MSTVDQSKDLLAELQNVFRETFQDDEITIFRETTASDIDGWDSLMHVSLLMSVEAEFGVRFSSSEVALLNDVGELIDLVRDKKG